MAELTEKQHDFRALRTHLRETCAAARRDAALFAALTVLLTPIAVALFILTLLFALTFVDLPVIDHLGYERSFLAGANLCLAFMGASYFLRPKERHQRRADDGTWLLAAGVTFGGILALSHLTPLATRHPALFWPLYLALALVMLGCVGHAYEPQDDYYLGWTFGPFLMDDPFTIQDDIDRAHVGLGFAVALSNLILESYGAIFGSRWLWRGLQESELSASAELLQGLAARDTSEVMALMRGTGKGSAANIVRALVKLELIYIDRGGPKLTMKGKRFLELKPLN